jgi:hypothetical protein
MWTVVYMTKNEEYISSLREKLKDNKIMVMVRKVDDFFEMLVPGAEMQEAHTVIIESEI